MALKGDLASVDLAQVFQMLALNQKLGLLCISSPSRGWKALYFEPRGTCLYFDEHVLLDKVLLQATRTGRMAPQSTQEVRDHAAQHGVGLADAVLAGQYLEEAELGSMMRAEMEEEIYDLFFWDDAHFEFFEGASSVEGRDGRVDPRYCFSTDSLIMEAARRIDEWSFIQERIEGPEEVFRPVESNSNILELEDSALALYDLVDGKRNVERLHEITGLPSFLVYKGLAVLLDEGLIEAIPPYDLVDTAQECVQEGRNQDAINLFERAIALSEGLPYSHEQVADVYETSQEYELASIHRKQVADYHANEGELRQAVEILQQVVEMLPTDLGARERLVELTVGQPDLGSRDFDAVANGKKLVDLYLETGEVERVRGILERLLRDNPFDVELKKSLINVHTKAGDTKRVIELYESIAEDLVQERQPLEAIKYLQKILMLDRNRKDVSERIKSLYVMDERRRNRRRNFAILSFIGVLAIGLAGAWWYYEQTARADLVELQANSETLIQEQQFVAAAADYQAFIERYQFTLCVAEAKADLKRVESLQDAHRQALEQKRQAERDRLRRARERYKMAFEVYKDLVDQTQLDKALQQLESVQKMVRETGEPEDLAWAQSVRLNENLAKHKEFLAQAHRLDRDAWKAHESGDWQTARAKWLELINDFEMTEVAKVARMPVLIRTRPAGAQLFQDGAPVTEEGPDGQKRTKVTPCVVLCDWRDRQTFELRRDGFEPVATRFEPRAESVVDRVLTIVPAEQFSFDEPVRGSISASRGFLAAGLRGGRVALVKTGRDRSRLIHRLAGLDDVYGAVSLNSSFAVFATREGWLTSLFLANGRQVWRERLAAEPLFDVQVVNNRALVLDSQERLIAWDAQAGNRLWFTNLGGRPAGPLFADGRYIHVALEEGQLIRIDASSGRRVGVVNAPAGSKDGQPVGLTTSAPFQKGAWIIGSEDGRVIATNGRKDVWSVTLDPDDVAETITLEGESVLVVTREGVILRIGLRDGLEEARHVLQGAVRSGPAIGTKHIYFTVRPRTGRSDEPDVFVALTKSELSIDWEFRDGGQFTAGVVTDGEHVWLGDSEGRILRLR